MRIILYHSFFDFNHFKAEKSALRKETLGEHQLQFVLDYSVQVCEAFSSTTTYVYTANDHQRLEPD